MNRCVLLLLLALCAPGLVYAHLSGGEDRSVGQTRFDIGWDPAPIVAGESVTLMIGAADVYTTAPREHAWLRIVRERDGMILFAGDLTLTSGAATITTLLSEPGAYGLTVRSGEDSSVFTITVAEKPVTEHPWAVFVMIVFICTASCVWMGCVR